MDLRFDNNFELEFDETNDLGTVEGQREFEQHLSQMITAYFFEHIGNRNTDNTVRKLRLKAKRVAQDSEYITSLESLEVNNKEGDSLSLYIKYNGSEEFSFDIV